MSAIEVEDLSFAFGKTKAIDAVSFNVPEGALYALLGPNGAGKSTLLHILMGLRQHYQGHALLHGTECSEISHVDRQQIGYIAEGQQLPSWMRLEQLESFLAPLYPNWDFALASELRDRFELDSAQKISRFSRGQYMKAATLCALAPRPKVLLMDEPFTGMDVTVKDDLVRGLLAASASDGCSIILSSHDIAETELLADHFGYLENGKLILSESMNSVRARFKYVDVILSDDAPRNVSTPAGWLAAEQSGRHIGFVISHAGDSLEDRIRQHIGAAVRVESRSATLKELFIALRSSTRKRENRDEHRETVS